MFAKALEVLTSEIVMSLVDDLATALRGVDDVTEAKIRVRGVLKAKLHEEVHNAVVRALR